MAKLMELIRRASMELAALLAARADAIAALDEQASPRRRAMRTIERALEAIEVGDRA